MSRPVHPHAFAPGCEGDDEYHAICERAYEVAEALEPFAAEADALSTLHEPTRDVLRDARLVESSIVKRWGGRRERVDPVEVTLIREQLMRVSAHADLLFACQGLGSYAIGAYGSDALQERWLPGLVDFSEIAALSLTEPQTGSDLRSLTTTVEASDGKVTLNGAKSFISNAGEATFYVTLGKEGDAFSLVLAPADAAGLTAEGGPELTAAHILGTVEYDNVTVDESNRVGDAGEGWAPIMETLAVFRVSVAGAAIGLAQRALEIAAEHAGTRVQFGKPLAKQGAVAEMLAESWTEVESARLLTYAAARRARDTPGLATLQTSSMAKVAATETAARVVDRTQQILGRFSMIKDSEIDRLWHAARPLRIYEGASEVLRGTISRELVSNVLSTK